MEKQSGTVISVYCTVQQKEQIKKNAKKNHQSMCRFLLKLGLEERN